MTRTDVHDRFVGRFAEKSDRTAVTTGNFEQIGARFHVRSPGSSCSFVTAHGAIGCRRQLHLIAAHEAELGDVTTLVALGQMIKDTLLDTTGGRCERILPESFNSWLSGYLQLKNEG